MAEALGGQLLWRSGLKIMACGAVDMAQWLRTLVTLTEDLDLIPRTHMAAHKLPVSPVPGDPTGMCVVNTMHSGTTFIK